MNKRKAQIAAAVAQFINAVISFIVSILYLSKIQLLYDAVKATVNASGLTSEQLDMIVSSTMTICGVCLLIFAIAYIADGIILAANKISPFTQAYGDKKGALIFGIIVNVVTLIFNFGAFTMVFNLAGLGLVIAALCIKNAPVNYGQSTFSAQNPGQPHMYGGQNVNQSFYGRPIDNNPQGTQPYGQNAGQSFYGRPINNAPQGMPPYGNMNQPPFGQNPSQPANAQNGVQAPFGAQSFYGTNNTQTPPKSGSFYSREAGPYQQAVQPKPFVPPQKDAAEEQTGEQAAENSRNEENDR